MEASELSHAQPIPRWNVDRQRLCRLRDNETGTFSGRMDDRGACVEMLLLLLPQEAVKQSDPSTRTNNEGPVLVVFSLPKL